MTTQQFLESIGACQEGREHVGSENLKAHWTHCPLGGNMLWVLARMAGELGWPTRDEIVSFLPKLGRTLGYAKFAEVTLVLAHSPDLSPILFANLSIGIIVAFTRGPAAAAKQKLAADLIRKTFTWPALDALED
jgi:hypothetical protein